MARKEARVVSTTERTNSDGGCFGIFESNAVLEYLSLKVEQDSTRGNNRGGTIQMEYEVSSLKKVNKNKKEKKE